MNDPGSLQNLNDIVMPPPVQWWPPAPAWYVVGALLLLALLWLGAWILRQRQRNRYRREALRLLASYRQSDEISSMRKVPELLKRTALSAWPRDQVAALSGGAWHRFLDRTAGMNRFTEGAGRVLDRLAYRDGAALSSAELDELFDAAEQWLRRHRAPKTGP